MFIGTRKFNACHIGAPEKVVCYRLYCQNKEIEEEESSSGCFFSFPAYQGW